MEQEITNQNFSIKKQNKADMVYSLIREGLVWGKWEPGDRLYDNELAEMFGCSRNSVREALFNLTRLHIVEKEHWKGYRVRIPVWKEIVEAIELRASLDCVAIGKLQQLDEKKYQNFLKTLQEHLEKAEGIIAQEPNKGRKVNVLFFHILYDAVSDYLFKDIIDSISAIPELLTNYNYSLFPETASLIFTQQVAIYRALEKNNFTEAETLLKKHIDAYKERSFITYTKILSEKATIALS